MSLIRWVTGMQCFFAESLSTDVHLGFEVFQEREVEEMLAISYLGLQACISRCCPATLKHSLGFLRPGCSLKSARAQVVLKRNFTERGPLSLAAKEWGARQTWPHQTWPEP